MRTRRLARLERQPSLTELLPRELLAGILERAGLTAVLAARGAAAGEACPRDACDF